MSLRVVNNYTPPPPHPTTPADVLTPGETHDLNFVFPIRALESPKIKLVPFIPFLHLSLLHCEASQYPEMFDYLPFGPLDSIDKTAQFYIARVAHDPGSTWFCVVDKTRPPLPSISLSLSSSSSTAPATATTQAEAELGGAFAGLIGLLAASREQSQAELGYLLIWPPFQRTHVTTHACALLLQYLLDPPAQGGLGLRRAQWKAHAMNERSVKVAERLGMNREAVLRWVMVMPEGKVGLPVRRKEGGEGSKERLGRHTVMLGMGWDDWEAGGRERVDALMRR